MRYVSIAAAFVAFSVAGVAHAQKIPLFTFENDEFAGESNNETMNPLGGANSSDGLGGGFGVTEGTQAFVVRNAPASQNPIFETTVGGSDTGEVANNYQAFRSAVTALESGKQVTFNFDFFYDFTNTTTGAFFQPGVIFNNAGAGYQSNLAYGGLAGGNVRSFGDFPAIGPAAAAGGATLTILDPVNYTDDLKGGFRMSIPVGLPGSGKPIMIGGTVPGNPDGYYQFRFNTNGGFGGTADYAFDNFYFNVVKPGDFNNDGVVNAVDIDLLFHATTGTVPPANALYDVNHDNSVINTINVANSDTDYLVHTILGTQYGDTNLDKDVDFDDLVKLAQNYGLATGATWSDASFNGDGKVDFDDLVLVAQNYGFLAPASLAALGAINSDFAGDWVLAQSLLPEPTTLMTLGAASLFLRRPRRH